jgi:hypothetical protein
MFTAACTVTHLEPYKRSVILFYCSTVHIDNIKVFLTNKRTIY